MIWTNEFTAPFTDWSLLLLYVPSNEEQEYVTKDQGLYEFGFGESEA